MKTALLMGDITGRSRVALRMLSAVLEGCGHEVLMLPTALISNTLNLGRHEALDTTRYMLRSLDAWEALGLTYDLAYIGYITGMEQAQVLADIADGLRERHVPVVLDPILGDGGRKYNSVSESQTDGFRLLAERCDLLTPNLTEACLLTGRPYADGQDVGAAVQMARLLAVESRTALITSAADGTGTDAIIGYDAGRNREICIAFERVPGHHWGTGDLFTGWLIDGLLGGMDAEQAARAAAAHVARQLRGEEKSMLPQQ